MTNLKYDNLEDKIKFVTNTIEETLFSFIFTRGSLDVYIFIKRFIDIQENGLNKKAIKLIWEYKNLENMKQKVINYCRVEIIGE